MTERVEAAGEEKDLAAAVATLRQDVERVAALVRPRLKVSEGRRPTAAPSARTRSDRIKGLLGEYLGIDALHRLADLDETNAHRADGTYTSVLVHPSIRGDRRARVIAARAGEQIDPEHG